MPWALDNHFNIVLTEVTEQRIKMLFSNTNLSFSYSFEPFFSFLISDFTVVTTSLQLIFLSKSNLFSFWLWKVCFTSWTDPQQCSSWNGHFSFVLFIRFPKDLWKTLIHLSTHTVRWYSLQSAKDWSNFQLLKSQGHKDNRQNYCLARKWSISS